GGPACPTPFGAAPPSSSPGTRTHSRSVSRNGSLRYDHLQAAALSVEDSAGLIARVMEERYGHQSGSDGRAVA
ncbi:hypothetical protein ACIHCQ_42920, partial [Streptomyces sp. NPDC052236]